MQSTRSYRFSSLLLARNTMDSRQNRRDVRRSNYMQLCELRTSLIQFPMLHLCQDDLTISRSNGLRWIYAQRPNPTLAHVSAPLSRPKLLTKPFTRPLKSRTSPSGPHMTRSFKTTTIRDLNLDLRCFVIWDVNTGTGI